MKSNINKDMIPELCPIPGGVFRFGDIWEDGEIDELPITNHQINSFCLSKYTITNFQYCYFLNQLKNTKDDDGNVLIDLKNNNYISYENSKFLIEEGYEKFPVVYVSWLGAKNYCKWLSGIMGIHVSLPTEKEWQYASMVGKEYKWANGNEFIRDEYNVGSDKPVKVSSGKPNEFGLYNISGNIFEWVEDEYAFSLNREESNKLNNHRVIKGGSF